MRTVLTALAIAIGLVSMPALSEANSTQRDHYGWRKHKSAQAAAAHQRKLKAQQEAADQLRADYLDPAGNFKGYPAWARAALSPKNDGGNRF
jgi:hypothetical protein